MLQSHGSSEAGSGSGQRPLWVYGRTTPTWGLTRVCGLRGAVVPKGMSTRGRRSKTKMEGTTRHSRPGTVEAPRRSHRPSSKPRRHAMQAAHAPLPRRNRSGRGTTFGMTAGMARVSLLYCSPSQPPCIWQQHPPRPLLTTLGGNPTAVGSGGAFRLRSGATLTEPFCIRRNDIPGLRVRRCNINTKVTDQLWIFFCFRKELSDSSGDQILTFSSEPDMGPRKSTPQMPWGCSEILLSAKTDTFQTKLTFGPDES